MKSTIFIKNITCLDYGYIGYDGMLRGNSYIVSANLTGKVSDNESVVFDFSSAKKIIKDLIDDRNVGVDHKLVLLKNESKYTYHKDFGGIEISGDGFELSCPSEGTVREIEGEIGIYIEKLVEKHFKRVFDEDIKCEIFLSDKGFTNSDYYVEYFSYFHSLPHSSSYGCKTFHGHRSFLEISPKNFGTNFPFILQNSIKKIFDNKILISRKYVVYENSDYVEISYVCSRGLFKGKYSKKLPLLLMDTDTTIEYMGEFIKSHFDLKGYTVYISEGLQKGLKIDGDD